MRDTSGALPLYTPSPPPADVGALPMWTHSELQRVAAVLGAVAAGRVEPTTVEPAKPREGMVRLADGTNWNPGAGAGVYAYYSGAWNRLG